MSTCSMAKKALDSLLSRLPVEQGVRFDLHDQGGDNTAFAVVDESEDDPLLEALYTDPEHRRRGLAMKLLDAVAGEYPEKLSLKPSPYEEVAGEEPPMSKEQLMLLYKAFGFCDDPDNPERMLRDGGQPTAEGV